MNLDEMLAASGITGGAKAENTRTKTGFVTFIGRPNVGKSTLMNQIIGQKIAITSNKPQTTRNRIQTVYTDERGQIVFVDTPGIHKAKNKLGEYMVNVAEHTLCEVDVILWLVEPGTYIGSGEQHILKVLQTVKTPVILVINKIDTVKKEELLNVIATYAAAHEFEAVVPISARTGEGLDDLLGELSKYAIEGPQLFPEDMVSDQPERQLVAEIIREKILKFYDKEIPYCCEIEIESYKEEPAIDRIAATIYVARDSQKGILIGHKGEKLKRVGQTAREDMEQFLGKKVFLQLFVKVSDDWRNDERQLRRFGYEQE